MVQSNLDEFVDLDEASLLMKIHPSTVRSLIKDGKLPAGKVGRKVVLNREHVVKYVNNIIISQTASRLQEVVGKGPQPKRQRRRSQ